MAVAWCSTGTRDKSQSAAKWDHPVVSEWMAVYPLVQKQTKTTQTQTDCCSIYLITVPCFRFFRRIIGLYECVQICINIPQISEKSRAKIYANVYDCIIANTRMHTSIMFVELWTVVGKIKQKAKTNPIKMQQWSHCYCFPGTSFAFFRFFFFSPLQLLDENVIREPHNALFMCMCVCTFALFALL